MNNWKQVTGLTILALTLAGCLSVTDQSGTSTDTRNNLLYAVAWKQTAAEYQALYYQGFNLARRQVEEKVEQKVGQAQAEPAPGNKPLAVISDLDETLLLAPEYWGFLIQQDADFFDDASWDRWIAAQRTVPSPGALEFLQFCEANGVEVFYVTNRDQGEATFALALQSLQNHGFPFADEQHLTVLRETSNKQTVQDAIRERYDVIVMLGDNLNDFSRKYYVTDVEERENLLRSDRALYGEDYIVFPNPTDGHWIRAIFGDSEPPPTPVNRAVLKAAAARQAWQPQ